MANKMPFAQYKKAVLEQVGHVFDGLDHPDDRRAFLALLKDHHTWGFSVEASCFQLNKEF